jgi:hypothetical protein
LIFAVFQGAIEFFDNSQELSGIFLVGGFLREFPPVPETLIAHGSPSLSCFGFAAYLRFYNLRVNKEIAFP